MTLVLVAALTEQQQEQAVTLDYGDPTAGADDAAAVQDAAGNDAAGFQGRQVLTLPVVLLALEPVSIAEDGGVSRVTATVTRAWTEAFTVTVTATPVAPAAATDFTLSGSTLSFAANATASSGTVTITARGNDVDAPDKIVTVAATVSTTEVRAPDEVTLKILDDEPADATLRELSLSDGTLTPTFSAQQERYTASVGYATAIVTVTATPAAGDAEVAFLDGDGAALPDAEPSEPGHAVSLAVGENTIRAQVSAHDGTTKTYTVTVTRKAPELQSVELVSDPDASGADDDTYQIGDTIAAATTFDVAVTVSGTPTLKLHVGGAARAAAYASGSGSTALTFAYTVAEGDPTAVQVTIGANPLTAGGGIAADGNPAVLAWRGTPAAAGHKVDGMRPVLRYASASADGQTLNLAYDEELSTMTAGASAFTVTVDGAARGVGEVTVAGSRVRLALAGAVTREQTVKVGYTDPTAGTDDAAAVQDSAGNDAVSFQNQAVLTLPVVTLELSLDSIQEGGNATTVTATLSRTVPEAFTVRVRITPVEPATVDDVEFGENVFLSFAANAQRSSGTVTIRARDNGVDTPIVKTVQVWGTVSTEAVAAPAEVTLAILDDDPADATLRVLSLSDGTLTPAFLPATTRYTASVANAVEAVTVTATANADDATVVFLGADEAPLADADAGAAGHQVSLTVGENTFKVRVRVPYDGTTQIYTVTVRRAAAGARTALLTSEPDRSGADDDTYAIGNVIEATVTFSAAVTVSGTPELELDVGGAGRTATYAGGTGSTALTFAYAVAEGDADADGVAIPAGALAPAGGTITAGGADAELTHPSAPADAGHKVDGVRPTLLRAEASSGGERMFLAFSEKLSSTATAAASAFTVTVAGSSRAVGSVAASGDTVTLTLAGAVTPGQTVTVSYGDPTAADAAAAAVRDAAGNAAADFRDREVLNISVASLLLEPAAIAENGGVSRVTATVSRSLPQPFTVTVTAAPVAPATAGDITVSGTTLSFAANATASGGTVTITARDNRVDGDRTVTVAATVSAAGVAPPREVRLTITDDDEPAWELTVDEAVIAEQDTGAAAVTVRVVNGVTFPAAVPIRLDFAGSTAVPGSDFTVTDALGTVVPSPYELTLAAGDGAVAATITAVDDTEDDDAEEIRVTARRGADALGEPRTITITDDDEPAITLAFTAGWTGFYYELEVDEDVGRPAIELRAATAGASPPAQDLRVTVDAVARTAHAGSDYAWSSPIYLFRAADFELLEGRYVHTVSQPLEIVDDDVVEKVEYLELEIDQAALPPHVTPLAASQMIVEIHDHDRASVSIPRRLQVTEGEDLVLTLVADVLVEFPYTVVVTLLEDNAKPDDDYLQPPRPITLAKLQTQGSTTIEIVDDHIAEPDETFRIRLLRNGLHERIGYSVV